MSPKLRAALTSCVLALAVATTLHCGTDGIVGGECLPGLSACGQSCVNLGSDLENCGSCGRRCEATEECLVGVCIDTGPAVQDGLDGGVLLPDGAIILPDGAVVGPDGSTVGGGGSGGGGGGGGDECVPPFNRGAHCGDCDTVCSGALPLCAPAGDSFECAPGCTEPLTACSDRCVDLSTDIDNCGACGQNCPTAICRDGSCVGGFSGHVVAICMNLQSYRTNAPQNSLLGNAVFLARSDTARVLGYVEHATDRVVSGVQRALTEANDKNARDIQLTVTDSAASVANELATATYDVFLIYDQSLAPQGALGTLGASWQDLLANFTAGGGVVIVLSSTEGTGEMADLIVQSNLFPTLEGLTPATSTLLYNREPSDAVGLNVFAEFRALSASCTYQIDTTPAVGTAFIVTDLPRGNPTGNPAVIHSVTN